jgi:pyridoxal phosphate enzyme (YggS family)
MSERSPRPSDVAALASARAAVLERIADACARTGRDPADVMLVAVSKTVPAGRLLAAVAAGLDVLGENRVQEAAGKVPLVPGARWHLVGPLQSNKARRAVELFETIESVDSIALAARLDRLVRVVRGLPEGGPVSAGARLPVLLQVNVDRDPAKAGVRPDDVEAVAAGVVGLPALRLDGLMTIGRLAESPGDARATFRGLRELGERLTTAVPGVGVALSMGMSDDYPLAVEEGATIVRVGRALFGERPSASADG